MQSLGTIQSTKAFRNSKIHYTQKKKDKPTVEERNHPLVRWKQLTLIFAFATFSNVWRRLFFRRHGKTNARIRLPPRIQFILMKLRVLKITYETSYIPFLYRPARIVVWNCEKKNRTCELNGYKIPLSTVVLCTYWNHLIKPVCAIIKVNGNFHSVFSPFIFLWIVVTMLSNMVSQILNPTKFCNWNPSSSNGEYTSCLLTNQLRYFLSAKVCTIVKFINSTCKRL